MKVLIVMDSFKGTFSSLEVADVVEEGLKKVYPFAIVNKVAIADGGEGTVDSIVEALNGSYEYVIVNNPLGKKIKAKYGVANSNIAIIEMAEASGLCLLSEEERNPLITSTYGTGEIIIDALNKGCRKIILGIGGSATNDGGMGMAMALGVKFLDVNGIELELGGGYLEKLHKIDLSEIDNRIKDTSFTVACDVTNTLCGEEGASRVFGPQKGADNLMVEQLERNLEHYANIIESTLSIEVSEVPGSGAAGGLGAGLLAFCNAKLAKGIDIILDIEDIDKKIEETDIVITGEGKLDGQSIFGKVPVGIAIRAKRYNKPVFAIVGSIGEGGEQVYEYGIDAVMSAVVSPLTLEEAIIQSPKRIKEASERLFRIIKSMTSL